MTTAPGDRRRTILAALSPTKVRSVNALSHLTGVSAITVRRDLAQLVREGRVVRVHGGALRAPHRGPLRPAAERRPEDVEAKRLLARAVASRIEDGESVIIDSGTTCELVAEQLAGRDLRVLCLSLGAGAAISAVRGTVASIAGGTIDPESLSLFSAQAVDAVRGFCADVAVLSTCAVSTTEGLTVIEESDAILKRAIMAASSRVILPVAPRKLGRTHTYRFGTVTDLDDLLTTADADPEAIEDLRAGGLPVSVIER